MAVSWTVDATFVGRSEGAVVYLSTSLVYASVMRHKLRIALLFLLLCLPGIVGGTWAWYAAAEAQPPFLRVLAALAGGQRVSSLPCC